MPTAVSYPGIYVEGLLSRVHTFTGVATSIAAFVPYNARRAHNRAGRVLRFADFERALAHSPATAVALPSRELNTGAARLIARTVVANLSAAVAGNGAFPNATQTRVALNSTQKQKTAHAYAKK